MKKIGLTVALLLGAISVAQASEELAKSKNCMTCHSVERKIVGPSYKDIVAKRGGDKGAVAALAGKIKGGSKGDWGPVPMPANAVSDAEAETLAKWVLSFK